MQLTQAILPVAGLGTRFLPWTKVVPKELLPIGNQPIIALLVDEAMSVGITDICFVISRGKEAIPHYFESDKDLEKVLEAKGKLDKLQELKKYDNVRFTTVYQDEQLGDGHAIVQAADWATSEHIGVLFGDDIVGGGDNGLTQLVRARSEAEKLESGLTEAAFICMEEVERKHVNLYGIGDIAADQSKGRLQRLKGLIEKPSPEKAPSNLAVIGKYIIPRSTMDVLKTVQAGHGGEIRLIDALIAQVQTMPVYGWRIDGKRLDTGRPEGYREAVLSLT